MELRNSLKNIIKKIPIRFTSNQRYDSQTKRIMQIVLEHNSTFIDVGSHKGEVLSKALKIAPARKMSLEETLEYIADDELVEVTPLNIRLRKRLLNETDRKRARHKLEKA